MKNMFLSILFLVSSTSWAMTAKEIIGQRCMECHNQSTWERDWTDNDALKRNKFNIIKRLTNYSMPPQNATGMTEEERNFLVKYIGSL